MNPQSRKVSPTVVKDSGYSDLESEDNHLSLDSATLQEDLSSPSPSAETSIDTYEISDPATLWGILASTQGEEETKNGANAGEETDVSEEEAQEMACVGEIQSFSVENMDVIKASGPATLWGILVSTQDDDEAKNRAHADETADFSDVEAPEMACVGEMGPATLWGILTSTQGDDKAKNGAEAGEETNVSEEEAQEMAYVRETSSPIVEKDMDTTETPGPATLWGILVSTQYDDEAKDRAGFGEETDFFDTEAQEMAYVGEISSPIDMDTTESSGPATLWGILESTQGEEEAKDRADAGEQTVISQAKAPEMACVVEIPSPSAETDIHITEASGAATLWGILASNQGEDEAKNRADVGEETADFSNTKAQDMAYVGEIQSPSFDTNVNTFQVSSPATLWGILASTQGEGESSPQVEKLEIIDVVPKPKQLSATQKRRAERKRKAERERADRKRVPQKCI